MLDAMPDLVFIPSKRNAEPARSTSLYIPKELLHQLDRVVVELGLASRSELVVQVMKKWLEDFDAEKKSKSVKGHR